MILPITGPNDILKKRKYPKGEFFPDLNIDFVVIHSDPKIAKILQNSNEKARLRSTGKGTFELDEIGTDQRWTLSNIINGRMRPFSLTCYANEKGNAAAPTVEIKDHIFSHGDNLYSIGEAIPIDSSPQRHFSGAKFICRLVNFPFSHIDHVDDETKHKMKRHRGIPVGDFSGLGADGFDFKLYDEKELGDIGLQLAASTYLLYTTR